MERAKCEEKFAKISIVYNMSELHISENLHFTCIRCGILLQISHASVCLSVCLGVGHTDVLCKTAESIEMPLGGILEGLKPRPYQQQCRSNIVEATGNFVEVPSTPGTISTQHCRMLQVE